MLEEALREARLLYAYTMYMEAPLEEVFKFTGEPEYWAAVVRPGGPESLKSWSCAWIG